MHYLKQLLHKFMYHDTCNVYRAVAVEDGYIDSISEDFELVYENLPCKLSQYGKQLSAHRDDRSQQVTIDLRLTCDPEYEILEDDVVEVQHQGETFKLWAGTSFNYPTHKEISVRRRREAGQE